jgi:long-chain acyl-CoA synthetase
MLTTPPVETASPAATRFSVDASMDSATIPQFIRRNATHLGASTAFRTPELDGWRPWTWSEVERVMLETAAGLLDLGHADRLPAFVIGPNSPEYFISEYAIQSLGGIAFPLFETMTAGEMTTTLTGYGAKVAFSGTAALTRELLDAAEALGIETIVQWGPQTAPDDDRVLAFTELRSRGRRYLSHASAEVERRIDATSLDDVACIILTSGTTGTPKGVMGTHRYMLDIAARYALLYGAQPCDSYLSSLPGAFSVEQYCGMALTAALPLNVAFARSPASIDEDFVSAAAQFRFLGPRQWEALRAKIPTALLERPDELQARSAEIRHELGLHNVKSGISAGGSLSSEVFDFFRQIGVGIHSVYGFSETGIITGTQGGTDLDSVGAPLPSPYGDEPIEVRVDDTGEILIRGGVRCAGYWGNAHQLSLTSDGWLRSGDAGTWDGRVLRVVDRVGNIKSLPDGTLFAPQPLEISACRSPFISNVLLVPGHGDDSRIGALIEINEHSVREHLFDDGNGGLDYAELATDPRVIALTRKELAESNSDQPLVISVFAVLPKHLSAEHGELTRSMKLRRTTVLERYRSLIDAMYRSPGTEVSFDVYVGRDGEGSVQTLRSRVAAID